MPVSAKQMLEQLRQEQTPAPPVTKPSAGHVFGRAALESFIGNFLKIPEVAAEAAVNIPKLIQGKPTVDINLPTSDPANVFAGAQRLGEAAAAIRTGDFSQFTPLREAKEQQQEITQQQAQQRPVAATAGQIAGDVATLTALGPLRQGARALEARRAVLPASKRAPGLMRQLDDIVRSKLVRNLELTGIRAGETGLEGAVLALLDEGDPIKTAALSAGGQAIGTAVIGLNRFLLGKSLPGAIIRVGTTGMSLGFLLQMTKAKIPGGKDLVSESFESGAAMMATIGVVGMLATIAGMGRGGGRFAENMPKLADAMTAIPRGAMISGLREMFKAQEEGDQTMETVITKFAEDPDFFGRDAARRIDRAYRNGKLRNEIDKLMKQGSFRKKLDQIDNP